MAWYWWLLLPVILVLAAWAFGLYFGLVAALFQGMARLLGYSDDEAKNDERQRRHEHAEYLKQKRREAKSAERLRKERAARGRRGR
jgi:hypothetical protein